MFITRFSLHHSRMLTNILFGTYSGKLHWHAINKLQRFHQRCARNSAGHLFVIYRQSGSCFKKRRKIMSIQPIRDEFVIADDITLHYVQWGTQGTPIICTHGMTANAMCFQALADELAPDHRIIAYDIRGRGDSDKLEEGYSIPIYATDLAALIDELELERPIVLGHSLGAMISLYF